MRVPARTCVGCRERTTTEALLRVVLVDGRLQPDPNRGMPGRGAWLHPRPACLDAAARRRAWPRALRAEGAVDASALEQYLAQREP